MYQLQQDILLQPIDDSAYDTEVDTAVDTEVDESQNAEQSIQVDAARSTVDQLYAAKRIYNKDVRRLTFAADLIVEQQDLICSVGAS